MKIRAYLKQRGLSQKEFATILGVTQGCIAQWIGGKRISSERALQIEKKTQGHVTREDLRPDLYRRVA